MFQVYHSKADFFPILDVVAVRRRPPAMQANIVVLIELCSNSANRKNIAVMSMMDDEGIWHA
jgi:hypothetical protein